MKFWGRDTKFSVLPPLLNKLFCGSPHRGRFAKTRGGRFALSLPPPDMRGSNSDNRFLKYVHSPGAYNCLVVLTLCGYEQSLFKKGLANVPFSPLLLITFDHPYRWSYMFMVIAFMMTAWLRLCDDAWLHLRDAYDYDDHVMVTWLADLKEMQAFSLQKQLTVFQKTDEKQWKEEWKTIGQ